MRTTNQFKVDYFPADSTDVIRKWELDAIIPPPMLKTATNAVIPGAVYAESYDEPAAGYKIYTSTLTAEWDSEQYDADGFFNLIAPGNLSEGDLILIKDQADYHQNGIYRIHIIDEEEEHKVVFTREYLTRIIPQFFCFCDAAGLYFIAIMGTSFDTAMFYAVPVMMDMGQLTDIAKNMLRKEIVWYTGDGVWTEKHTSWDYDSHGDQEPIVQVIDDTTKELLLPDIIFDSTGFTLKFAVPPADGDSIKIFMI